MVFRSTRLISLVLSLSILVVLPAEGAPLSGRVIDASGRPVPRALVRILDSSGKAVAEVFTRLDGTFSVDVSSVDCRVEASLSGFATARASCDAGTVLTLAVAPVSEAIVVTANRSETPGGQVAASTTVFTADEIDRRQAPPVADLLATSPGVVLSRSGGYGSVASIFVRGGESNYNKVLLDGIPLNEPGGVFNFSNLTSANLERIEIVRGAHSALFGSDAMASVVQLFTRRPDRARPQVNASVEGGTFETLRTEAGIRGMAGAFDYSIGAAHLATDNEAPNDHFRNETVSLSVGYQLAPGTILRGVLRGEYGESGAPGQTAFGRPDLDASFDRNDTAGGVTFLQDVSPVFRHRATYGLATTRQESANLQLDPSYTPAFEGRTAPFPFFDFPYHSRNRLRRHYATYQADWTFSGATARRGVHQVTGAIDWDGERGSLENVLEGTSVEIQRDNVGITLQHQASWPRLFATGGLRFERNESFGSSTAPRGSIAVILRRSNGAIGETRVKASAGRGIKEPTALQSFSPSPFFLGNADLEPEESRSLEAGIEQRMAQDRVRLEATWFDNEFRNIISTRTVSFTPFVSQYFNIGRTKARGLELAAAVAAGDVLRARGGYTLLDSRVVESRTPDHPLFGIGRWLFRRPRHSGFVEASAAGGPVLLSLSGTFVGRRIDSDFSALEPPLVENEAFARWDVRGSYRLSRRLALTFAVDNVTNEGYMEPLGYPALGRALRLGMRAGF